MTKESGRKIIEQKIEDFEKDAPVLKKKGHGETNIRTNYIDVLFEALGWNMKSHYDVLREYSQRDTSGTKKVDYAFKINGKLKFFVEAKEASIDLEHDKDAIYQAKRYAYSTNGRAPIIILTDFEAFRVFNVLKSPAYDNTERELLKHYSMLYSDYLKNWDLLWDSFSKEAVGNSLCATYSEKQELIESTIYIVRTDKINLKYILGLINSKLLSFYLSKRLITNSQGFPQVLMGQLEQLPIAITNEKNQMEIVSLVEQMLQSQTELHSAKSDADKRISEQKVNMLDKKIDELVYKLYELTDEEIKIVEGN